MAHRVLVIRPGALGDIILTLPAMQALVRSGYEGGVELMGNSPVIAWLIGRSAVSSCSSFDRRDVAALYEGQREPPQLLADYLSRFELVLNYASGAGDELSCQLRRLCRRVLELDVRPGSLPLEHMSDYLQRPLIAVGLQACKDAARITPLPSDHAATAEWLRAGQANGRRIIAVHPGSGSPGKNWPSGRFVEVIRTWASRPDVLVVLILGPADECAATEIRRATTELKLLELDQPPLPLLAALLQVSQLYVGNDSGVSHLAAAVGTPTVVLFGPTNPVIWAPRGPSVRVVRSIVECSPCTVERRRTCAHHRCLSSISVERVVAEMEFSLLGSPGQPGRTVATSQ